MDWLIPQFGFSYIGLIFLLLLFVPNLLWMKNKPKGYDPAGESRGLQLLERVVCAGRCLVGRRPCRDPPGTPKKYGQRGQKVKK